MKIITLNTDQSLSYEMLRDQLTQIDAADIVLISKEKPTVQLEESALQSLLSDDEAQIILPASANFPFPVQGLNLYYWKYYPRERDTYHYVYSKAFLGKAKDLRAYFSEIKEAYGVTDFNTSLNETSDQVDVFHRYYLDVSFGLEKSTLVQSLDRNQSVFGTPDGRRSALRFPLLSLRHGLVFYRYVKAQNDAGNKLWDLAKKGERWRNKRMKTTPAIVLNTTFDEPDSSAKLSAIKAYVHSLGTMMKMWIYNGGKRKDHEIFRFRHNQNPEIKTCINQMIDHLNNKRAFSFTHFNDGEMTFIKKFEEQDHKEVWFGSYFGRIQEKYNKQLGELLTAAFLKRQDYYYIGIPCEVSHPKLSHYAKILRPVDDFTIPAMTFHHNLSKYPEILGAMRKRKVYFVVNVNQDLTFFTQMGFDFDDEQIIRVPFRNAHEEYDTLKTRTFEKDAVVLLMSGMLAKILCAYWFEHNKDTTFIAFGSSFDDYIQSKINFNLYPQDFPFSKTLIGSRSYLFGHKKTCKGCYDMSMPNPGSEAV